jgi:hypothetical protein
MNRQLIRAEIRARLPSLARKPPPPRPDRTAIILGRDQNRQPLGLSLTVRLEHIFMVGSTGSGKSRNLLHFLRQALLYGEGAMLLDPHGSHGDSPYQNLIQSIPEGKCVHVIDFSSSVYTMGFNPLYCPPDTDPSVIAGNMLDAMGVSWEGESFAQRPSIERRLTTTFSAIADLGLTLVEAPMLLDHRDEHGLRRYAIDKVKDPYTREDLQWLQELSLDGRRKRDYEQEVIGPKNRLQRLLRPPALRAMLGQRERMLDVRAAMDNGDLILVNGSPGTQVYEKDADLFGRLLVRTVLFHAKRRDNLNPFTVMLDEAHRYLSNDIPTLLAEVRKYGISIVAAIQWLDQAINEKDDRILQALLKGTNTKIIFRNPDAEEAEKLAHSTVPVNLEEPVKILNKPAVVGHLRIELKNGSESNQQSLTESLAATKAKTRSLGVALGETSTEGIAHVDGEAEAESASHIHSSLSSHTSGAGSGASAGEVMVPTGEYWSPLSTSAETAGTNDTHSDAHTKGSGDASGQGHATIRNHATIQSSTHGISLVRSKNTGDMEAETKGKAATQGTSKTEGFSEALEPIIQWLPSAVHSKDNQLYKAGLMLRSLPRGTAYINFVGQSGTVSTLFTVPPIFTPKIDKADFEKLRDGLMAESPAAIPIKAALWQIADREATFLARQHPQPKISTEPRKRKSPPASNAGEPSKDTW